jgi:UDP-N-acetylglucosamine:LPS N-acetylglucosamine transferase
MPVKEPVIESGKKVESRGKVLAVASSGGHWVQLRRVIPAFEGFDVVYVTVLKSYRSQVPENKFYAVNDATRWNKLGLVLLALRLVRIIIRERPSVVISTGAAPGYFAVLFGRWFGARTIWIDSMANIEDLSMSGSRAGRYADLWLTQWPHLARAEGPHYGGSVL